MRSHSAALRHITDITFEQVKLQSTARPALARPIPDRSRRHVTGQGQIGSAAGPSQLAEALDHRPAAGCTGNRVQARG